MKSIQSGCRRLASALLAVVMLLSAVPAAFAASTTYQAALDQQTLQMKVGEEKVLTATVTEVTTDPGTGAQTKTLSWEEFQARGGTINWYVRKDDTARIRVTPTPNSFSATVTALATAETTQEDIATVEMMVTVGQGSEITSIIKACEVTVKPADAASVTITPPTAEVAPGKTVQLSAQVLPETAPQEVTWASANNAIATVDGTGLVTGHSAGKTQITATSSTKTASATVTVQGIVLKDDSVTMRERGTYTLAYEIFGDQIGRSVTWTSSDSTVVRVTDGYLYAIKEGTCTITAKVNGSTYTDSCTITVERNMADVITESVDAGEPLSFSGLQSRLQSQSSSVLGRSLSYISGLSVDSAQGTLYYRYQSDSDTGAGIGTGERYYVSPPVGQRSISDITFVPKPDFSGTAVIHYTGYADGSTFFQGTIEVRVAELQEISYSVTGQKPVQFNVQDFNNQCRIKTGRDLDYVVFSQTDSDRGTLYYNYISESNPGTKVESGKGYRRNGSPSLGNVYFLPNSGYTGEVVISYTGYDVNGDSFRGRVKISVSWAAVKGDLNYSISQGGSLTMDDDDFNDLSKQATGYALDHVRFSLPGSSEGTLYYNYTSSGGYDSRVEENRSYYRNSSPYLRRVTFQAASAYTGTTVIDFTAWDIKGNQFFGTVSISVGQIGRGDIRYSTYKNGKITFDDTDFDNLCRDLTGTSLRYVRFSLPSSAEGVLYYNYKDGKYDSKVSASTNYYRYSSPYIDKVTFVPKTGFTGTVTIHFTGWSSDDKKFEGNVEIGVDSGTNQISYRIGYGDIVTFDDTDFDQMSEFLTGDSVRYVRFALPSSSKGTLYYNYSSSNSYNSKVSSTTNYYFSNSPYIGRITFVPNDGFTGTVNISYTGWSTAGKKFEGQVEITVAEPAGASVISYTSYQGFVTFNSQDFVNACANRGMGSLTSVQFTPPSSSIGKLYYQYGGLGGTGTEVRSGTNYYPNSSPRISEIAFVPKVGYQGTATINYTGRDSRGNTYQGEIWVIVQPKTTSSYFTDMSGYSWAASAVDLLYQNGIVSGVSAHTYSPGSSITRGDFMVMLYRAFDFPAVTGGGFYDVPSNSYYSEAIRAAQALGIASGFPDGGFHPQDPVSREDAMVLLKRAMQADGWNLGVGDTSLLNGFTDGREVSSYARDAAATMVEYGILSGTPDGRLNPHGSMTRAEMAVVLANALTL